MSATENSSRVPAYPSINASLNLRSTSQIGLNWFKPVELELLYNDCINRQYLILKL